MPEIPENQSAGKDKLEGKPLSQEGANFFIVAAGEYPASNTAQAARLAELSLLASIDPSKLSVALLKDGGQVGRIVKSANFKHGEVEADVETIDQNEARRVVLDNYMLAAKLTELGAEKLRAILELYPQYIGEEDEDLEIEGSRESAYRNVALGMLDQK